MEPIDTSIIEEQSKTHAKRGSTAFQIRFKAIKLLLGFKFAIIIISKIDFESNNYHQKYILLT